MAVLRKVFGTSVAMAVVLTIGAPPNAEAQGQGKGKGPTLYTPAAGAKDLKSVIFNWAWYTGMLRSSEEQDLIMSLEYTGKGTVQVDGQPCNVTKYRRSISYQTSGERIQITGTRPNGQNCSTIEVLSGAYAWNEDIAGAELIKGKGKATPMPATAEERMIRLWAGPQGAWKAAMAGVLDPPKMAPKPGIDVPAGVATAGKTSVVWAGNKSVLTFPIPGVPNATATATLDAKFMAEKVVVKQGANTTEFTYSDYKDWNNPLNPAEAFIPGKMTEKKNGTVVRDIATTLTETGQMYVVMPVPASVKAAIKPTNQPPNWTLASTTAPAPAQAAAVATPRRADGKPDMTGNWGNAPLPVTGSGTRRCGPTQVAGSGINPDIGCKTGQDNFWVDYEWISPSRFGPSRPNYKPEFWDKLQELDQWTNKYDPVMTCQPLGLPRQGTPNRIIQGDKDIVMFYRQYADYGGGNTEFRDIPTDGRARTAAKELEATYFGYSIGKWEGDTLVIDSNSFVDSTWLGRGGLFHSSNMHIVERLTRVGNELRYDMMIEDPDSFVEPWVMPTRILRSGGGDVVVPERAYCEVYEENSFETQLRH